MFFIANWIIGLFLKKISKMLYNSIQKLKKKGRMAKLANAPALGADGAILVGSSPTSPTKYNES